MDALEDPQVWIVFLAAVGSFLSILAVALPFLEKDTLGSRLKAVAARREELSRQQKARLQKAAPTMARIQPKKHVDLMRVVLDRLKLQNLIASRELRVRLSQAGWRGKQAAIVFGFTRLAGPVVLMLLATLFVSFSQNASYTGSVKLMIVTIAAGVGYYLPMVMLTNAVQRRQKEIQRAFPDALDLLSICVEAGLSVEAAFSRVSEEVGDSSPDIAEEFGLTTAELAFLADRRQAFDGLAERTGLPAVKSLAMALVQAEKYGTPVTVSLRVLSQENRDARMSAAEKKAGALPAQLTVPMILFFLPVLFIVILGPAILKITTGGK
ncbi:MAG: type II secretion system F family protein [Alphaproteobacteria bacterium]